MSPQRSADEDKGPRLDHLRSIANDASFTLRERLFGRLRLRRGLPKIHLSRELEREQSFYRHLLSEASGMDPEFGALRQERLELWDIGCRNWSYLGALTQFFPHAKIRGVELDARRRYWNLFRRGDYAQAFSEKEKRAGRDVEFQAADFLKIQLETRDASLFCFFFPFVSEEPCLKWGLPLSYSNYFKLLEHVRKMSRAKPTWILSAHQGEWEAKAARQIYAEFAPENQREIEIPAESLSAYWEGGFSVPLFLLRLRASPVAS